MSGKMERESSGSRTDSDFKLIINPLPYFLLLSSLLLLLFPEINLLLASLLQSKFLKLLPFLSFNHVSLKLKSKGIQEFRLRKGRFRTSNLSICLSLQGELEHRVNLRRFHFCLDFLLVFPLFSQGIICLPEQAHLYLLSQSVRLSF